MNSPGLRERKKQKTRWAIQEHALRLIAEQGYDATTIDQIAAAAEISPSTFFRYFPSKEDLIIEDEYDAALVEGLRTAPPELSPLSALRHTMRQAFVNMPPEEKAKVLARTKLTMSVPALRARTLENFLATMGLLRDAMSFRTGRSPDDFGIRALAGAIVGALVASIELWVANDGADDIMELVDRTLAALETGFG
jgi:AcrR family transcriptional regulator